MFEVIKHPRLYNSVTSRLRQLDLVLPLTDALNTAAVTVSSWQLAVDELSTSICNLIMVHAASWFTCRMLPLGFQIRTFRKVPWTADRRLMRPLIKRKFEMGADVGAVASGTTDR